MEPSQKIKAVVLISFPKHLKKKIVFRLDLFIFNNVFFHIRFFFLNNSTWKRPNETYWMCKYKVHHVLAVNEYRSMLVSKGGSEWNAVAPNNIASGTLAQRNVLLTLGARRYLADENS